MQIIYSNPVLSDFKNILSPQEVQTLESVHVKQFGMVAVHNLQVKTAA